MSVDLASQLHDWAMTEMHFRPQGSHVNAALPSKEDFRDICVGPMVDVWQYVLKHVRSSQTTRKIQGNLALKSRQLSSSSYKVKYGSQERFSQEKADLLEKRKQLTAELTSSLATIGHVEKDLDRLRQEISHTESLYRSCGQEIGDLRRRSALLQAFSWRLEEETAKYKEFSQTLKVKVTSHSEKMSQSSEAQYQAPSGSEASEKRLETACTKEVRQCLDTFNSFLKQLVHGDFSNDPAERQQRKALLWQRVEDVLGKYPASQVSSALTLLAQDSTLSLRDRTAKIDIAMDAQQLRFHYESGQLRDMSSNPSSLQSVHQLLMESQCAHLRRFMDTENYLNQTHKLQERLKQATDMVNEQLHRAHKNNQGALDMAKKLYEAEIQAAANKAALRALEDEAEVFKDKISQAAQNKERLYAKYQKIQDFRTLTEKKQELIRVLVKRNGSAKGNLETLQLEVLKYIHSSLGGHDSDIRALGVQLKDSVNSEVEKFAKLPLAFLMFTLVGSASRIAVLDLSIHRLQGRDSPQSKAIANILQALDFPYHKAPECLLPAVMTLTREINDLETTLKMHNTIAASLESQEAEHTTLVQRVADLCRQIRSQDEEQMATILPMLQKRLSQASQALADCLKLRDTTQAWWEQPAQDTTPWMTVDDRTLQQWKDQWTVTVTRLRQQHMG